MAQADASQFTTIDVPNARSSQARGINAQGDVVGLYLDVTGQHGFLLHQGSYTTIDDPNAVPGPGTRAFGINAQGDVVGFYTDFTGTHGFLLSHG